MNERKTQQAKLRQQVAPFPFFLACLFTSFVRGGIHKPSGTWNPLQALFTHDKPGRTIFWGSYGWGHFRRRRGNGPVLYDPSI